MMSERAVFWWILAAVILAVALFALLPKIQEELGPQPVASWVAVEVEGQPARTGVTSIEAGTPFTLHAVLEAQLRDGSSIYYTEAKALEVDGQPVPSDRLRSWSGPLEAKVLWFTVEGAVPYLRLDEGEGLDSFRVLEFFRPEWPQTWAIPGSLDPANDSHLARPGLPGPFPFGTLRYAVSVELYGRRNRLVPEKRFRSPGVDVFRQSPETYPTVRAALPGVIGPASEVFGLTEVVAPEGSTLEVERQLRQLTEQRLAYSRLTLLGEILRSAGIEVGSLSWQLVDLEDGPSWGSQVTPGDLVQAGDRYVVLYEDQGEPGVLDRDDLCFDYAGGALVRPLAEVFTGGGDVEWAHLEPTS